MLTKKLIIFFGVICVARTIEKSFSDGRIVGGIPTTIDQFPHQVSMQWMGGHLCGGSILNEWYIVTAAHCTAGIVDHTPVSVRAGTSFQQTDGVVVNITEIIVHEKYDYITIDYDISLLKLAIPLTFSDKIKKVSLPEDNEIVPGGTMTNITGWGNLEEGGVVSYQLQLITIPTITNEECSSKLQITDRMLCAIDSNKDSCQGDSGGPMVVGNKLVGIVSWGYGCARPGYPGVYGNVGNLRSWIRDNIGI